VISYLQHTIVCRLGLTENAGCENDGRHVLMCELRITLIFDIFRIGVVTDYGEGMLNLLNLFSLKRLPLLSQFHIVLFYVLL